MRTHLAVLLLSTSTILQASPAPAQAARQVAAEPQFPQVTITAGRSTVLTTDFDIARVAVTDPKIADAVVVKPREVLVDGRSPGTVSLILWGSGSQRSQFDVVVNPGVAALQQELQRLFPADDIRVSVSEGAVVLSGRASTTATMLKAGEIADKSAAKASVINLIQLPGGSDRQQVMLQVRFAEVNQRAVTELGASFFTGATGYKDYIGRSTTQQFSAPGFDELQRTKTGDDISLAGKLTFSDFLNLFIFNTKHNVGALIRALQAKGYFQSLAEPNLIAYNGQEASFLAGGEIPVPIVQGVTGVATIVYKEFGIRLNFRPTIAGDTIRLHVRPEVSSLDYNNGVTLEGFRIPALQTRRAETEVELRDGQSFAIAGLLDNVSQSDSTRIPVLGHLPIIGALFRAKAERKERTELMVLITPRLVRPLNADEVPPLPTSPGKFLPPAGIGDARTPGLADAPPVVNKKSGK